MKILKGILDIVCVGTDRIPSVREICRADPRIIYLEKFTDKYGNNWKDGFLFTLSPLEIYTVKKCKVKKDGNLYIETDCHYVNENLRELQELYEKYSTEVYVGTVVEDVQDSGKVWHDTFAPFLGSKKLYIKEGNRKKEVSVPYSHLSYCDGYRWRITIVKKDGANEDYTFLFGIPAYNAWTRFFREGKKALQNFAPYIENITDYEVRTGMKAWGPELCKAFEEAYSTEGFLNLD